MTVWGKGFLIIIGLMVVVVIGATGWRYLINEHYDFVVEASCDPSTETCFYRDCSTGECPPNELENYKVFTIEAKDFDSCEDNSCKRECEEGIIACEELVCGDSEEDECAVIPEPEEEILPAEEE